MASTLFNGVASEPLPKLGKQLVVIDWDRTLSIKGRPHQPLYLFAALALKKGHEVIIATQRKDLEPVRLILQLHAAAMKATFPAFRLETKANLREILNAEGHKAAYVVFDNEPETVPQYMDTKYIEYDHPEGKVDNIFKRARDLGFGKAYGAGFATLVLAKPEPSSRQIR